MTGEDYTFFGSKKVPYSSKTNLVNRLFSNVSGKYDLMNDLMSGGIHRIWKESFCMALNNPNAKLLDMAGGTCDITKRFYEFAKSNSAEPDITVCDLNFEMILKGREKLLDCGIANVKFVNSPAESLPFKDNSFDYYTVSFGIRNFTDINSSLKEAHRVLKKGGTFFCLEFSKPTNDFLASAYEVYSNFVIPNLGAALGDRDSYQYLVESIKKFPAQEEFLKLIKDAGFKDASYRNLSNGIVAIHTAFKK